MEFQWISARSQLFDAIRRSVVARGAPVGNLTPVVTENQLLEPGPGCAGKADETHPGLAFGIGVGVRDDFAIAAQRFGQAPLDIQLEIHGAARLRHIVRRSAGPGDVIGGHAHEAGMGDIELVVDQGTDEIQYQIEFEIQTQQLLAQRGIRRILLRGRIADNVDASFEAFTIAR